MHGIRSRGPAPARGQPGVPIWPRSPWTHASMTQGQAKGDVAYARSGGGSGYTLRAHLATGKDWVLD